MRHEDNERMTRVGPGTPAGEMVRRYWMPACLSSEIAEPDCDPVRLRIAGENLVAFRDSQNRVGILEEGCPHRGASLALGRNEECGLRCIYHGWKFDVNGEPVDSLNCDLSQIKVKAKAYPAVDLGGLIWVYMGPEGKKPQLPEYPWTKIDEKYRVTVSFIIPSNWQQGLEGLFDPTHAAILHADNVKELVDGEGNSGDGQAMASALHPEVKVQATDFGYHYTQSRPDPEGSGKTYARVGCFVAPFTGVIAPGGACFMARPIDDYNTCWFGIGFDHTGKRQMNEGPAHDHFMGFLGGHKELLDRYGLTAESQRDPNGASADNRWNQDREAMKRGETFSGIHSLAAEDAILATSSGSLFDRTRENLIPADYAIVRFRRILFDSMKLVEQGEDPVGVDCDVDYGNIWARSGLIDDKTEWAGLVPEHKVRK